MEKLDDIYAIETSKPWTKAEKSVSANRTNGGSPIDKNIKKDIDAVYASKSNVDDEFNPNGARTSIPFATASAAETEFEPDSRPVPALVSTETEDEIYLDMCRDNKDLFDDICCKTSDQLAVS